MSDVEISYKGNTITSLNDSGTKVLTTAGKYCEGDITVGYTKPAGGDPYDIIVKYANNTLEYFKTDAVLEMILLFQSAQRYASMKNLKKTKNNAFYGCRNLVYVNLGTVTEYNYNTMNNSGGNGIVLVINSASVPTSTAAVTGINQNRLVFVRDSLVPIFKNDTNWSAISSQIFGYSDLQIPYSDSQDFPPGSWCQYNNKFYCYCYEELTTIRGHAPSGTNSDNEYWEYINDLGV